MKSWFTLRIDEHQEELRQKLRARRQKLLAMLAAFGVVLLLGAWYSWASIPVTIVDGEQEKQVVAFNSTVGDLLEREGIVLAEHDKTSHSVEEPLTKGMVLNIYRGVPVSIEVDGEAKEIWSAGSTVAELLANAGIDVSRHDLVTPGLEKPAEANMNIGIVRVTNRVAQVKAPIPYQVERKSAYNLPSGQTRVATAGKEGQAKEVYRITYHDGQEVERQIIKREEISRPQNQVVMVGKASTVSRGGQDIRYDRMIQAEATAYTHTGNNTATGAAPGPGTVAVDPRVIPLGTRLYIEGYGYGTAMDTGGRIVGNRIDVFFNSRQQAVQWGRRTVNVYILK